MPAEIDPTRSITDDERYRILQEFEACRWESLCRKCGACCGLFDGDPCRDLRQDSHGQYFCRVYDNRFGIRQTKSGKMFRCVPIREILDKCWTGNKDCEYKKYLLQVKKF